ncbi:MAG: nitroreductase [Bacteroidia bacterium]|nr:nitroreductase [Bacteroidia bacterium]
MNHQATFPEAYLYFIEQATKAPSGHNTQPWLFRCGNGWIEIHPNLKKALPVVDGTHRELFISLGCAAENLILAASSKGYNTTVTIHENGVIVILLNEEKGAEENLILARQIDKRQCNKGVYTGQMVAMKEVQQMMDTVKEPDLSIQSWEKGTAEYQLLSRYIELGNEIQMRDKAFKKELTSWMRFNKKEVCHHRDGLSYATFGAPNLPAVLSRFITSLVLNASAQNRADRRKLKSSSHLVLLSSTSETPQAWINTGRALERFLLCCTQKGVATAFLNQPCEVTELASELAAKLLTKKAYPLLLVRIGYASPMPYAPRKKVSDVILTP